MKLRSNTHGCELIKNCRKREVDTGEKESAVAISLLGCALKLNENNRSKCRRKRRILVKPWLLKIGKKEEFIKIW